MARQAKGDTQGAVADYTRAIRIKPRYPLAYANRGLTLLALGKDDEAAEDFERCLKLNRQLMVSLEERIKEIKRLRERKQ